MRRGKKTEQSKPDVFAFLGKLYASDHQWGSAGYVRWRVRVEFDLTWRRAKELHLEWADSWAKRIGS